MKKDMRLRAGALAAMLVLVVAGAAAAHNDSGMRNAGQAKLAEQLADARIATAKYALDLDAAKADGYSLQITPNMPNMGFHFLNPSVSGFDVTKPPILVYVKREASSAGVPARVLRVARTRRPSTGGRRSGGSASPTNRSGTTTTSS